MADVQNTTPPITKTIMLQIVAIMVASALATAGNMYVTTQRLSNKLPTYDSTLEALIAVDDKVLANLRLLEVSTVRLEERFLNTQEDVNVLKAAVVDRYTARQAEKDMVRIETRLKAIEADLTKINDRLRSVERNVNNN